MTRRLTKRWGGPAAALFVVGAVFATQAAAFSGLSIRLPVSASGAPAPSPRTGLTMAVDGDWFERGGYRPVEVVFESSAPASSDKRIEVALSFAGRSVLRGEPSLVVRQAFVLPAGQTRVAGSVLCPQYDEWNFAWWDVTVDGQPEPALSLDPQRALQASTGNANATVMNLLSPRDSLSQGRRTGTQKRYPRLARMVADEARSEFFDDWLAYTSADVVVLDLEEVRTLFNDSSAASDNWSKATALQRWVASGGTLWVEHVGAGPEGLREISHLMDGEGWRFIATEAERELLPEPPPPAGATSDGLAAEGTEDTEEEGVSLSSESKRKRKEVAGAPGWGYDLLETKPEGMQDAIEDLGREARRAGPAGVLTWLTTAGDTRDWYASREIGFGRVQAFRQTAFSIPDRLRNQSLNLARGRMAAVQRWGERFWAPRHGVGPGAKSGEFGNLLIPGVGTAPVTEFQVLITLFVLVIGPLNYWLLARKQRLHLLILTTPLCALAVTAGLFAYALIGDGFGVKVRARSVTLLNQSAGEAVSWSRLSHYAGMAPPEGIAMPSDAAVYPIRPAWESAITAPLRERREVVWDGTEQRMPTGWLPSRTAVQNLVIRARPTDAKLLFSKQGEGLSVSNRLGAPIDRLLVLNEAAEWLTTEGLEAGAAARLEPIERLAAMQALRVVVLDNEPVFPIGAGKAIEETLGRLGDTRSVRRLQRRIGDAQLDTNLMNRQIDRLTGLDGGETLDVPPRTYVALTTRAVETPLGVAEAVETGSFHVVVGRW